MNKESYGIGADVWGLGVLFYLMLFKKYPFRSNYNCNIRPSYLKIIFG